MGLYNVYIYIYFNILNILLIFKPLLTLISRPEPIGNFVGHTQRVSRVAFHPSGKFLGTTRFFFFLSFFLFQKLFESNKIFVIVMILLGGCGM